MPLSSDPAVEQCPGVSLAARLRAGDSAAFAHAAREHQVRLVRLAGRFVATREDAEDVVQDATIDAYRQMRRFRGESSVGTWLARIVIRRAMRAARRRRPIPLQELDEPAVGPETGCRERAAAIREAVDRLPSDQRAVVVLRFYEGLSGQEIAELLGLNASTVWTRLYRALKRLRTEMEEER